MTTRAEATARAFFEFFVLAMVVSFFGGIIYVAVLYPLVWGVFLVSALYTWGRAKVILDEENNQRSQQ